MKNKALLKAIFWGIISGVLALPILAVAQEVGGTTGGSSSKLSNPLGISSFAELIGKVANIIMQVGIPIAAIFLIYSGLLFVTARGDEKKLQTAKDTFFWTVVGAGILLGAVVIAEGIEATIKSLE